MRDPERRDPERDEDWQDLAAQWKLRGDTTYLNHGSFGPPPRPVQQARAEWQRRMDEQPMDFFVRQHEPGWHVARTRLAAFVGAAAENLVFQENATAAMNVVANSFPLAAGDEVLLTDHEYGAVQRIWQRRCAAVGAQLRTVALPGRFHDPGEVVAAIAAAVTARTRMAVVSHITSPTAITLPVAAIGEQLRERDVAFCIDGPHAVAQLPLALEKLGCDFYAASCHKWLSAPFGSGFLYAAPRWHARLAPTQLSWGRLPPAERPQWSDEFIWCGTRDYSPYLAIPAAIEFMEQVGLAHFRARTHALARYARQRLVAWIGREPLVDDDPQWYTSMAHVPLPPGDARTLQRQLWETARIEVPIVDFQGARWIRVSCHLYNQRSDIDRLLDALQRCL